ncbi:hypothetical protein PROFUN_10776 [Planoprotostelium fungivorum]|uniref:Uncharacterized protein n=1 Tax=Planoprotostelium fungivorum TaxID=1890364 RepID=A0A2P6NCW0_9EUKA|nr:hypothetical protein PROFUN_10776 [Planoprotostelium fungivorum]
MKEERSRNLDISVSKPTIGEPIPSRWLTPRYFIYAATWIYFTIWVFIKIFSKSNGLRPGWFNDRKRDESDMQWKDFRKNFPLLLIGMTVFLILSKIVKASIFRSSQAEKRGYRDTRVLFLFYCIVGIGFIIYAHGWGAIWWGTTCLLNYFLTKSLKKSRWTPVATWVLNCAVLATSDYYRGYRGIYYFIGWESFYNGALPWQVYYRLTLVRNISFSMDYYWKQCGRKVERPTTNEYKMAVQTSVEEDSYGLMEYIAYVTYPPLYIGGPIITFNAFVNQVYKPTSSYSFSEKMFKLVKVCIYFVFFEIWLHYSYQYDLSWYREWKNPNFDELDTIVCSAGALVFMFFRSIALLDGVDSPENMARCVFGSTTFTDFWRFWHSSFNQWITRYLYIPLGGNKTQIYSIWIIFLFVGLWHDLQYQWIAWALINCVFFSVEIIVRKLTNTPVLSWVKDERWEREMAAIGGLFACVGLSYANLAILYGFEDSDLFIRKSYNNYDSTSWLPTSGMVKVSVYFLLISLNMQEWRRNEHLKEK